MSKLGELPKKKRVLRTMDLTQICPVFLYWQSVLFGGPNITGHSYPFHPRLNCLPPVSRGWSMAQRKGKRGYTLDRLLCRRLSTVAMQTNNCSLMAAVIPIACRLAPWAIRCRH